MERIVGASPTDRSAPRVGSLLSGANELVHVIGGMGPKNAQARAREALGFASIPNESHPWFGRKRNNNAHPLLGKYSALSRAKIRPHFGHIKFSPLGETPRVPSLHHGHLSPCSGTWFVLGIAHRLYAAERSPH